MLSAVRSILVAAGASLTAHGVFNADSAGEIVGAIMVIIPLAWGVWDKYRAEKKARDRETVAINVGIVVADATVGATPLVHVDAVPALIAEVSPFLAVVAGTVPPAI
jgi:hypothetical protein